MIRRFWMVGVVAALALGCGEGLDGGGIPDDPGPGGLVTPGEEEIPKTEVPEAKSLWPLTTGSTWTYRINDPVRGIFEKRVEVLGEMAVPGTSATAIAVKSVQPHLEELSWQIVKDGAVMRVREEDSKDGQLVRITTWSPLTMKALDGLQNVGWSHAESVSETVADGAGNVLDTKQKDYVWSVAADGVQVAAPMGAFEGAVQLRRLRSDKDDWERTYWLVPGIGKVREEGERTEELLQVDIKP